MIFSGRNSRTYPDPLQRLGILNPANWILPATSLSIVSPLALLTVTLLLLATVESWTAWRLRLPAFASAIPALAAMLLSWLVAWRCSRRPGRLWPRLWALLLALASTALAPLAFFYAAQTPALAALGCGALAGAMFLLPRLLRMHPNSFWIGWIGLLMLFALILLATALTATVTTLSALGGIELSPQEWGFAHA